MAKFEDVAQRWASGKGKTLRAASMNYRGAVVYSHGTPIARLVYVGTKNVALVTSRSYSIGTSRATNCCKAAAKEAGLEVFEVDSVYAGDFVSQNLHHYSLRVRDLRDRASRARTPEAKAHYTKWANTVAKEARRYKRLFEERTVLDALRVEAA